MALSRLRLQRLLPSLTLLSLIPLWEVVCRVADIPSFVLPAPSVIAAAFLDVDMQRWLQHLWSTLRVALAGFAMSFMVAIPLSVLMVRFPFFRRTVYPLLVIVQSMPVVAIAPLLVVILGTGEAPRLVIACLITFFPLVVSATTGMLETPRELLELSRSLGASAVREIWAIRLPYAVPHLFSGMRVAVTLAIIGAVVAEFVAAEQGLGYFVQFSTSYFKIPQAFAALFFLALVSLTLFKGVQLLQALLFRWSLPRDK